MYKTRSLLQRKLRVTYPVAEGARIVLRTDLDWDHDLEPSCVEDDGRTFVFNVECKKPFLYVKGGLRTGDSFQWSVGPNLLVLMTNRGISDVYPFFNSPDSGSFSPVIEIDSKILGRKHLLRVYLPPGYDENTFESFPTLYMQDGKNLFFPEEAFLGNEWHVDEDLALLNTMTVIDRVIVVGIYSQDRVLDYTKPGYEKYGRSVVEEVVPEVKKRFRVLDSAQETGVMGSSLGGVVSFYMAWQWPDVFGSGFCLSSTFSYNDDLIDRVVSNEPTPSSKFYLDSGWPGDNYEVTLAMAMALNERGCIFGKDFMHVAFPLALHDERSWGERLHLPLQLFRGRIANRARYEQNANVKNISSMLEETVKV